MARRCICIHCLNAYLKKLTKSRKNPACKSGHYMCVHQVSMKNDIFGGLCKKDNFRCLIIAIHGALFNLFIHATKMSFLTEILCVNIGCPFRCTRGIFFLKIFAILKCVFYTYFIIGVTTPMSQNAHYLHGTFLKTLPWPPTTLEFPISRFGRPFLCILQTGIHPLPRWACLSSFFVAF